MILLTLAEFFLLGCLALVCGRTIFKSKKVTPSLPVHLGLFAAVLGGLLGIDALAAGGWVLILAGSAAILFLPFDKGVFSISTGGWKGLCVTFAVLSAFIAATLAMNSLKLRSLPPALQSAWFAPHVSSYMIGYALVSVGSALYIAAPSANAGKVLRAGFAFLVAGMSMGALWAHSAWGSFWSWDPKESMAAAFATAYAIRIHLEGRMGRKWNVAILIAAFMLLNMCWWGLNLIGCTSLHAAGAHI